MTYITKIYMNEESDAKKAARKLTDFKYIHKDSDARTGWREAKSAKGAKDARGVKGAKCAKGAKDASCKCLQASLIQMPGKHEKDIELLKGNNN